MWFPPLHKMKQEALEEKKTFQLFIFVQLSNGSFATASHSVARHSWPAAAGASRLCNE